MIFDYVLQLVFLICIFSLLSLAMNLLLGYSGLLNLGVAALFGIGAYSSALLSFAGIPVIIAIIISVLITGFVSLLLGIPSLRLSGDYLALVTLGFGLVVESLLRNWRSFTNGSLGLSNIPSINFILVLVIISLIFVFFLLKILVKSPYGRLLKGIRDDEIASKAMGKKIVKAKLVLFLISGLIIGLAGSFYAHYSGFVDPSSFRVIDAILILSMVVIGGLGSFFGSIIGVIILVLLPELLGIFGIPPSLAGSLNQLFYALILIILVLYRSRRVRS